MFIVAPAAGAKITGDSMIGEYFRVFISYARHHRRAGHVRNQEAQK